jgi:transposase-like protein
MGQSKRIRRSAAVWLGLFSRQSSSGLSVSDFCRREGINASLFRRWRSTLKADAGTARGQPAAEVAVPFIDLGDIRSSRSRVEVRLELGAGIVLSIAHG